MGSCKSNYICIYMITTITVPPTSFIHLLFANLSLKITKKFVQSSMTMYQKVYYFNKYFVQDKILFFSHRLSVGNPPHVYMNY
jgi:hypothetical protein